MVSITYLSSATSLFGETQLLDLVDQCQRNNTKLGITGILVYSDGNFMQVIEGPDLATETLYERIKLDARHRGVTTVHKQRIEVREFEGWSMAYNILPPKPLRSIRLPEAFLDRARKRPLPLPEGSASRLVCSFMQH
jgi:Sensors of blue-light using FAD